MASRDVQPEGPRSHQAQPEPGRRVLMVEDDPSLRELYQTALQGSGYEVTAAASGMEALELAREGRAPDILVVDVHLGDIDGLTVARKILERHPNLLVVVHTAHPDHRADFASWCAEAFVVKSPDLEALGRCIGQLLDERDGDLEKAG